jgi:hypothetical protein
MIIEKREGINEYQIKNDRQAIVEHQVCMLMLVKNIDMGGGTFYYKHIFDDL